MLGDESEPDEPAPVLADEGDLAEVETLEHGTHPVDVALVGVVVGRGRFVGAAEADEIGCHSAATCRGKERDHLPVEIRPRRLTVQEEDGWGGLRSLVEVVDAEAVDLEIVRAEGVAR